MAMAVVIILWGGGRGDQQSGHISDISGFIFIIGPLGLGYR
jgi:hypothetical protein